VLSDHTLPFTSVVSNVCIEVSKQDCGFVFQFTVIFRCFNLLGRVLVQFGGILVYICSLGFFVGFASLFLFLIHLLVFSIFL